MSTDLIERLDFCAKLHPQFGNPENGKLFAQAAARIRELEATQDDHALMIAYQKGFSDGHAKAEEDAALSALEPAPITPAEARENVVDTIEEIICETHDLDVRDRDYAENVVAWLEKYHPSALRALAETPS